MFIERVSTLDSNMKNKVNTGADIARSADSAYDKDFGRVGSNVEAESWVWGTTIMIRSINKYIFFIIIKLFLSIKYYY